MDILQSSNFKCSVSSVLNKDTKQHGKNFLFDSSEETSWSSHSGAPQSIAIQFEEPQEFSSFRFQFQGGFVGQDCIVRIEDNTGNCICEEPFYPDDINTVQTFNISKPIQNAIKIKFTFGSSSDFFGRIIVYNLSIFK